jgi:GNAT superfamily N-acetyltransferase
MAVKWDIRPVVDSDYEQWRELYHGYREFYKQERSEDVVNIVWSWIRDPNHVTEVLVAVTSSDNIQGNKKIILGGLVHYRRWPYLLKGKTCLYGDDLFILPESRGHGIATLLIKTLSEMAKKEGLGGLRWTTESDNTTARRLYDSLGTAISKVTYEMVPGSNSSSFAELHSSNGHK